MGLQKIYETKRLYLRPTSIEDAAFIFELFNTPKWLRYIGNRNLTCVKDAEDYIVMRMLPQLERSGVSTNTVIRKVDGAKIGTCGLYDREGVEGLDIGFAFLPEHERQGYAFEAAGRILKMAEEDLKIYDVAGVTSKENIASQNLLKKLGLRLTGEIYLPKEMEKVLLFRIPGTVQK